MQTGFDKHIYRVLIALALLTITTGTVVYHFSEHWSWLNSYYFSVITLATVGYGDFAPTTPFAKIFTTFYILVGVGIITAFISYTGRRRTSKIEERRDKKSK